VHNRFGQPTGERKGGEIVANTSLSQHNGGVFNYRYVGLRERERKKRGGVASVGWPNGCSLFCRRRSCSKKDRTGPSRSTAFCSGDLFDLASIRLEEGRRRGKRRLSRFGSTSWHYPHASFFLRGKKGREVGWKKEGK